MRYPFVLLAVLVLLSGVLLAQSINHNEAIPECTSKQAAQAVLYMDLIVNTELEIIREQEQRSDYPFYQFDMYMKVLRNYDEDYRPRMPQCALALRFEIALYRLLSSQGFWNGANMLIQEGAMFGADFDADSFLKLEDVPPIADSAVEEFDTIWQELVTLAEESE